MTDQPKEFFKGCGAIIHGIEVMSGHPVCCGDSLLGGILRCEPCSNRDGDKEFINNVISIRPRKDTLKVM